VFDKAERQVFERLLTAWGKVYDQAAEHARTCYPAEACGLLVRVKRTVKYWPCRNQAPLLAAKDSFVMHPEDWVAAEEVGDIVAVVHSHPDDDAHPSSADKRACHRCGLPWFILATPGTEWRVVQPAPLPLVGREFVHGQVDCYTLVQDYYDAVLGIDLPDFTRTDEWWAHGQDLYRDGFSQAGFVDCGAIQPRRHDVLLMQVAARVDNHAAVFVGPDPDMPGTADRVLHHLYGRLSGHDVWGGDWARRTTSVLRHKKLMGAE
jgi:proteasome lid subunit RPN8/RPN11